METSEKLDELAKALAKAQATIQTAKKDSINPHFKSKFADLASIWDACRKPLTDNGLSVIQGLSDKEGRLVCTTMILHESGQYIRDSLSMRPQQETPQAAGSCATYLRRYTLQAAVGIAPDDDDDGQLATTRSSYKVSGTLPVSNGFSSHEKYVGSLPQKKELKALLISEGCKEGDKDFMNKCSETITQYGIEMINLPAAVKEFLGDQHAAQ